MDDHEVGTEDTAMPQLFFLAHPTKTFLQLSSLAETRQHNNRPLGPGLYHNIDQIVVKFDLIFLNCIVHYTVLSHEEWFAGSE